MRHAAERVMVFPVFEVPGFEHVTDQPEKPLVTDSLREDPEKDRVSELNRGATDPALAPSPA